MALMDSTRWEEMLRLRVWTPLLATALTAKYLSANVRKVGDQRYLFVVDSDATGDDKASPYITMVMWAETDGAALRAADGTLEADVELPLAIPAPILLPQGSSPEYGSILDGLRRRGENVLESAEYRIASDGAFLHKAIQGDRGSYLFRRTDIVASEKPFAITLRLR